MKPNAAMRCLVCLAGLSLLALSPSGCGRVPRVEYTAWLALDGIELPSLETLSVARVTPSEAVLSAVRIGPSLVLTIDVRFASAGLRVEIPGACPLSIAGNALRAGETRREALRPSVIVASPAHPRDLGFDAPFSLEAASSCGGPTPVVAYRQLEGAPLRDVRVDGARFEARTQPLAFDLPWGVVPISPAHSGEVVVEAAWHEGNATLRRSVRLSAASRSRGLPNVGLDTSVLLGGAGWRVEEAPQGAKHELVVGAKLSRFLPSSTGRYVLRDGDDRTLSVYAGRYDEMPLDCARAGCHVGVTAPRAMTTTLETRWSAADDRGCLIACHATGEPGASDGGFAHVSSELRGQSMLAPTFAELPRDLRRLGGVGCLACHGPGAIPEPSARWAILRADVCAHCHDAPPRYGHVAAWRMSRMARSDADPRTREGECARCHTTSGWLASPARGAPSQISPLGIGCAACHAMHGPSGPRLLRAARLPKLLEGVPLAPESSVCVDCHAPGEGGRPAASAAAIFAGRGGLDPETGAALVGSAVHGGVSRGCIGCHHAGPTDVVRGGGHAFASDAHVCGGCHAEKAASSLHAEATALYARLTAKGALVGKKDAPSGPPHARPLSPAKGTLGRAAYDVLLVLEDPAAFVHNAPYARMLLSAAHKTLGDAP